MYAARVTQLFVLVLELVSSIILDCIKSSKSTGSIDRMKYMTIDCYINMLTSSIRPLVVYPCVIANFVPPPPNSLCGAHAYRQPVLVRRTITGSA